MLDDDVFVFLFFYLKNNGTLSSCCSSVDGMNTIASLL